MLASTAPAPDAAEVVHENGIVGLARASIRNGQGGGDNGPASGSKNITTLHARLLSVSA